MNVDEALKVADSRRTPAEQYSERMAVEAHALVSLAAELRRLREEVATLTDQRNEARELATQWSNEGGAEIARLQAREAKARELMERIIRDASVYYDVGMYIPDATRWLAEGE